MHPRQRQQQVVERRKQVAALRLAGVRSERAIAERLHVHQSTISRDLTALDAEWQREAADCIAREKALDLQRIERLIQALWPQAISGEAKTWHVDRLVALLDRKAKLLGLDAPVKREDKVTMDFADAARQIAEREGLDPAAFVAEAEAILRQLGPG